ncbi:hypothetical protein ONE63_007290 [Megalurothrips usitatus]|uniref:Secreted protein n=1 Tax=Megalurothrips usitatus TaxID=439358 RepID=A0AAV7XY07_9NEOP|nr:hypothetical protein ONE63_007290 [Megalurothrips usitatus]
MFGLKISCEALVLLAHQVISNESDAQLPWQKLYTSEAPVCEEKHFPKLEYRSARPQKFYSSKSCVTEKLPVQVPKEECQI